MPRAVPADSDILCENCGYMLNGLPDSGNCPECGVPVNFSISQRLRRPTIWEDPDDPRPAWRRFLLTSAQVIFHPGRFYRSMTARGGIAPALSFARLHCIIGALLLSAAAWMHTNWYVVRIVKGQRWWEQAWLPMALGLPIATYFTIMLTTRLASRLTAWEAAYRGYRLPLPVVLRALYYHNAHLLPVGLLAAGTVGAFTILGPRWAIDTVHAPTYLYILSGEVIFSAGYLFNTYWIGMRNLMYANR